MTNLSYKDESNCILLAEVFDSPKNGGSAHRINVKGGKGRTAGYPEKRKEERCFLRVRDRYLTLYYTIGNLYFSVF